MGNMRSRIEMRQSASRPTAEDTSLAATLRKYQEESGRSVYQISNTSGVDAMYLIRIMRGEKTNVSREVVIRIGVALVLEADHAEKVIETTNDLLDAAGFKRLQ